MKYFGTTLPNFNIEDDCLTYLVTLKRSKASNTRDFSSDAWAKEKGLLTN